MSDPLGRIVNALKEHLAASEFPPDKLETFAWSILTAARHETGGYNVWDAEEECAKLDALGRAAADLSRIWSHLHPNIRGAVRSAAEKAPLPLGRGPWTSTTPAEFVFGLDAARQLLDKPIQRARKVAHRGIKSKRNLRAISVVDECRKIWAIHTNKDAPNSDNEASAFGRFLADVFEAADVKGDPRSSIDSWKKFRASEK